MTECGLYRHRRGQIADMTLDPQALQEALHRALYHLYEPDRLRQTGIASLLGVANRVDSYSKLQGILIDAIGSLELPATDLVNTRQNELYELLYFRFVQQMPQQQVARQLGMSTRHLRRREHAAIELLAEQLWQHHNVSRTPAAMTVPGEGAVSSDANLDWVRDAPIEMPPDLSVALGETLALLAPLTKRYEVRISTRLQGDLPPLEVHAVALNQLLLALLTDAVHCASGGEVAISASQTNGRLAIVVRAQASQPVDVGCSPRDQANLDLAQRLARLSRGALEVQTTPMGFVAQVTLPTLGRHIVLVIDDNADTLELLRRYVTDSRYSLVTGRSPEAAFALAQEHRPAIIVLDVMMPQIDGWKLLGRLREHPALRGIPILVFTIVPQEEMALALGAAGYLKKPVTRRQFLEALDALLDLWEKAPH